MLILSIETAGEVCSIAVVDDGGVVAERAFRHRMRLLERLVPDTLAVLEDAGAGLASVDLFAVGIGPGSFTGVRVGVMTAKSWADVFARPIVGVDSLTAVAEEHASAGGVVVPVVRARPGQVYAAVYRAKGAGIVQIGESALSTPDEVVTAAREAGASRVTVCGDGLRTCGPAMLEALGAAGIEAQPGRAGSPRASTLAQIAAKRAANGQIDDPVALAPCYIAAPAIKVKAVRDPWAPQPV